MKTEQLQGDKKEVELVGEVMFCSVEDFYVKTQELQKRIIELENLLAEKSFVIGLCISHGYLSEKHLDEIEKFVTERKAENQK